MHYVKPGLIIGEPNGSRSMPFRKIKDAVAAVPWGATIIAMAGNYSYEWDIELKPGQQVISEDLHKASVSTSEQYRSKIGNASNLR